MIDLNEICQQPTGGLAIWRGDEYMLKICSLIGFSSRRRITPSNRINNELLFINLASVTG